MAETTKDWKAEAAERRARIAALVQELGLTMTAEFVPWSRSRSFKANAKLTDRNLNWKVTILKAGREILTTDYSAGLAHCPSYKQSWNWQPSVDEAKAIEFETENGRTSRDFGSLGWKVGGKPIEPDLADVLHSLASDCDVLDYSTFEEWAPEFGYDPDSRKAEGIYRECIKLALALRNGLGEPALVRLREAFQDY